MTARNFPSSSPAIFTIYLVCALEQLFALRLKEWQGWEDFLGVCLTFDEGRKVSRALEGIHTEEDYLTLIQSKTIPDNDIASRLPYRPDLKYKHEWLGWDDYDGA